MGATKSLDELNTVLDQFADKVEEIRNQPAKVDEAFDKAAVAAAASEGGSLFGVLGATVGAAYGAISNDDFTGYMQEHKKEIKDKIRELLTDLHDASEGLRAPVAFLQTSEEWLKLKSMIGAAQNNEVNKGNVLGYWQGSAALRYGAARTLQDTAMDSAKAICDKLGDSLAAVANSAWEFYSTIVQDIIGFLVDFGAALSKIATGVGAPWGVSDAIDALAGIIKKAVDYGKKLVAALLTEKQNINRIHESTANQKGFHNDHWPQSASRDFDTEAPGPEWAAL
ncbi:hypothetical protein IFM12275_67570 [Nocardia sputorum]|uniref:hypothetical protein n=1 Tax=Nocardia TaxID=1817 RepID=UPI002490C890|nr:hypothetical protein [Nocardia sputorum]BDT96781.1 hypothetical protein IFM12275_67570 [Nocardia sputorum]